MIFKTVDQIREELAALEAERDAFLDMARLLHGDAHSAEGYAARLADPIREKQEELIAAGGESS